MVLVVCRGAGDDGLIFVEVRTVMGSEDG
jgi:hypothetical protein